MGTFAPDSFLIMCTAVVFLAACGEARTTSDGDTVTSGLYHRRGGVDAISLEIDGPSRTFRWGIYGCDSTGGAAGRVEMDGEDFIMRPPEDGGRLGWPGAATDTVRLSPGPEAGQLVERDATPPHIWESGGICAVCGGGFGPTGLEPCDDPVLELLK